MLEFGIRAEFRFDSDLERQFIELQFHRFLKFSGLGVLIKKKNDTLLSSITR